MSLNVLTLSYFLTFFHSQTLLGVKMAVVSFKDNFQIHPKENKQTYFSPNGASPPPLPQPPQKRSHCLSLALIGHDVAPSII